MSSRKAKIGPAVVASLKAGDIVFDTDLSRFGVRRRNKSTSYFVKVRIDRRQRWINLGRNGPVTASEARAKARQVLADVDAGRDPTRERDKAKTIPLFSDFAETWLREHVTLKRKSSTAREYRRIVERHLTPALGTVRIDRIDRADVLKLHARMVQQPYIGNRAIATLSAVMTFAEKLGHRPQYSNPCRGIERYREFKRRRPLSMAELAALWTHLGDIEPDLNPYIVGAIRLLILTGMRREEVLTLQWKAVDLSAGIISLADAKTGPRDVVLSRHAIALLSDLPRMHGNEFVFPGLKAGQRLVNISKAWSQIRTDLGFPDVRIHDLRHTVASVLARSAPLIVVRDALGHSEIGTTSGYSHAAKDDVRAALNGLALTVVGQ